MDFSIDDEQQMVVDTVRAFVNRELAPYEDEVERTGQVRPESSAADSRTVARLLASMRPTCLPSSAAEVWMT